MNLPNKITVFRLCMLPVFLAVALIDFPYHWCVTIVVYFLASISDLIDGRISRKRNLTTDFGKLMDPLSDKVLVLSAFAVMILNGYCNVFCFSLILAREFLVSGIRMIASTKGQVIPANIFGKIKTFYSMCAIGAIFLGLAIGEFTSIDYNILYIVSQIFFWIACAISVISGLIYTKDGWYLIETK